MSPHCEPTRYLRDESDRLWHLRDTSETAGDSYALLCQTNYDEHANLVGTTRPATDEPICQDCAGRYLNTVDDDSDLTASLLVGLAAARYIERTPRVERLLLTIGQALEMFHGVKVVLYHVAESLILAGQTQMFVRSIIERVIEKTLPTEEEMAEQDRRLSNQAGDDEPDNEDSNSSSFTWFAVLAPVGVRGETGQVISPDCVVTVREGAPLVGQKGDSIGRVDRAAIVDGWLSAAGVLDEAIDLSAEEPVFTGGPSDQCAFGPFDEPTVTFSTLEITEVRFSRSLEPAWSDPMISFTSGRTVEQGEFGETSVEV